MKVNHPQHPLGGPPGQADKNVAPGQAKKEFESFLEDPELEPEQQEPLLTEDPAESTIAQSIYDEALKKKAQQDRRLEDQQKENRIAQSSLEEKSGTTARYKSMNSDLPPRASRAAQQQDPSQNLETFGSNDLSSAENPVFPEVDVEENTPLREQSASINSYDAGKPAQNLEKQERKRIPGQEIRDVATGRDEGTSESGKPTPIAGKERAESIKQAIAALRDDGVIAVGKEKESKTAEPRGRVTALDADASKGQPDVAALGIPVASYIEPPASAKAAEFANVSSIPTADLNQLVNQVMMGVNSTGQPEFQLNLNLQQLGEVQVRITQSNEGLSILFNAQTEKGGAQLAQNFATLQLSLEQKGLVIQNLQLLVQNQSLPIGALTQSSSSFDSKSSSRKDAKDSGKGSERDKGSSAPPLRGGGR